MSLLSIFPRFAVPSQRSQLWLVVALAATTLCACTAQAQFAPPDPGTRVKDAGALKPPAGAKVAIVEFLDLQCPDCALANTMLKEAVARYHIPWVRHDFPLPFHSWSHFAAVNARWFDRKNVELGNTYRDEVFANQKTIKTPADLRLFSEKFAKDHALTLPAEMDPDGKLLALVKADYALGQRVGVEHTPTTWVVTSGAKGAAPFVEVLDNDRLMAMIEEALQSARTK